ncbi:MAG: hypothetical protein GXP39_02245 [Chloroflexi bacterium]|nr:hypothetical protein [Chloroflexota bacterium]
MKFRPDIDEVLDRQRRFFAGPGTGKILIQVEIPTHVEEASRPLETWRFPDEWKDYIDSCIDRAERAFERRLGIPDDTIPVLRPWFGIQEFSSFLGGEVKFSGNTSWCSPILEEGYAGLENLQVQEAPWFRMLLDAMAYLGERSQGRWKLALRGAFLPMDLANALRGNDFFTDLMLDSDRAHQLLRRCTELILEFCRRQLEIVRRYQEDLFIAFNLWIPHDAFGHFSNDASSMCSPETYRELGAPYDQGVLDRFPGGGAIHLHSAGLHALKEFLALRNLLLLEITDDPNAPRAYDRLEGIVEAARGTPLLIYLTPDELREKAKTLRKGNVIVKTRAANEGQAREIIAFARRIWR